MRLSFRNTPGAPEYDAVVNIVSANMILIECGTALHRSDQFDILIDGMALVSVVWIGDRLILCQSDQPLWSNGASGSELADFAASKHNDSIADFERIEEPSDFGKRLQRIRLERGLKQSDIAEHLRVSVAAVSQWESGRMQPRGIRWTELADCLGVGLDELAGQQSTDHLWRLVNKSRAEIARAAGINPRNVRISLDI
jgi:DNA-binding transcriptional regulator YiaG